MVIDYKKPTNAVKKVLYDFVTDDIDGLDVYCAFGYDEVNKVFDKMENGDLTVKPVHFFSAPRGGHSRKTIINQDGLKGEKLYYNFNVYTMIKEINLGENERIHKLMSDLTDDLRELFLSEGDTLENFFNLHITPSEGIPSQNTDNIYVVYQELSFFIIKRI